MKFSIYEEFPSEENLEKLIYLDFPIDIIVASRNLKEFQELKRQIKYTNSNVQRIGYWPTLSIEEGYWLSPFSKKEALERIISELEACSSDEEEILLKWDAELPLVLNKGLIRKEAKNFSLNKRRINEFLKKHKNYNLQLITAEWPTFLLPERIQKKLGVAFNPKEYNSEKVKMVYTSFKKYFYKLGKSLPNKITKALFKNEARKGVKLYGKRFSIGVGCLAGGIIGNEPLMTPEEFESDLKTAQEENVSKVFIFRLGGLDKDYIDIIKNYL